MPRRPLSRERVVEAAASVADRGGLAAVSMRSVGKELGVEAMSLYHHVDGKEALLDALADRVFTQIRPTDVTRPWREAMTERAVNQRAALARHPWALGLLESRTNPSPILLRHHDSVLGCLLGNGFPLPLAAHAFSLLDAYVYGFVLTEVTLPFESGEAEEFAAGMDIPADEYPHMARMLNERILGQDYDFGDEFEEGLTLILDALAARL